MTRTVKVLGLVMMFLTLAAGCRTVTGQSLGTIVDDQTMHASIKAKLGAERLQNLTWVGVDVENGVVTLSGNAASEVQKQRAENIARSERGVRGVVNVIEVTPRGVAHAGQVGAQEQASMQPSAQTGTTQQVEVQQPRTTQQQVEVQQGMQPAASPGVRQVLARQTVPGEIRELNPGTGLVRLTTPEGRIDLNVPEETMRSMREGDRVMVEMVIRSAR